MAGLVPAIHVFGDVREDVDARDKCGHDAIGRVGAIYSFWLTPTKNPRRGPYCGANTPMPEPSLIS